MDTPDKAAGLANSQLADSSNREWLIASARSSQLSASLHLEASPLRAEIHNQHGAQIGGRYGTTNASSSANERSWLSRHYVVKSARSLLRRYKSSRPHSQRCANALYATGAKYTINNHIYDNISFADSPILRSHSSRKSDLLIGSAAESHSWHERSASHYSCDHHNENADCQSNFRFQICPSLVASKFRYFLACYVLLGITLAIYSRNALSLAAVGMVANNALNKEMADILVTVTASPPLMGLSSTTFASPDQSGSGSPSNPLDGACPLAQPPRQPRNDWDEPTVSLPNVAALNMSGGKHLLELNLRSSISKRVERGELVDWTPGQQGLIFAAGSVGNLLIAIPLTRLGEIYGPKWIIFVASLGATIQAAFMPLVSPCNVILVIIFQVVFNGLTYGADCVAYTLFAHWLTPTEMAFFVSCLLICYQLGTILSSFATANILSHNVSWSWCFYTPAILCGIWTLIWMFVGASEPGQSRLISRNELCFLTKRSKIAQTQRDSASSEQKPNGEEATALQDARLAKQHLSISWLRLAKDPNIWAICAVKFTLRWYFSAYLSLMPTYLSSIAHMSVGTIGKMSVVQSFIGLFSGILMGFLTKSLVTKRPFNMSLATTRKFFQSIVNFGLVISLIVFVIYDCNQWVTIISLTLGGICINFYVAAALQLPLDLSPNHCGLITSITNTLAFGQALGAPISGLILNKGPRDRSLWRAVWLVAIVLNLLSGLVFIFLVDSKPRDYSKSNEHAIEEKEEEEEVRNRISSSY